MRRRKAYINPGTIFIILAIVMFLTSIVIGEYHVKLRNRKEEICQKWLTTETQLPLVKVEVNSPNIYVVYETKYEYLHAVKEYNPQQIYYDRRNLAYVFFSDNMQIGHKIDQIDLAKSIELIQGEHTK